MTYLLEETTEGRVVDEYDTLEELHEAVREDADPDVEIEFRQGDPGLLIETVYADGEFVYQVSAAVCDMDGRR